MKPPLGRKVTTADADHCRALGRRTQCYTKGHRECGEGCLAPDRLQWVGNGLTLFTADDYNSKVLSERGGAGQRVGYTKTGPRASPNRITQNHPPYCGRGFSIAVTARPPAGPPFSAFRTAVGAVGSLLAIHPWMAEEIVKPLLHFSSFRVGHLSGLAVLGPRPF